MTRIRSLYVSQASPAIPCMQISVISTNVNGSQPSTVVLCIQKSDFITRNTGLHMSQLSSVCLYIQNSEYSTSITSLYWSQPSSVAFACTTATLGPDLLVCIGPRTHLWICAHITACLAQEYQVSIGSCSPVVLCMQNIDFRNRITSLFWSQTSPGDLCMKTAC